MSVPDTTSNLAERLVQAGAVAIAAERHDGPPHLSDEEWAEVAVAAVLRELASTASARGTAASESVAAELRSLIGEIEESAR